MKSAYELAMERLQASEPDIRKELSDTQKSKIAELETIYKAKIAERDVFLKKQLAEIRASGNLQEEEALLKQIVSERRLLEEELAEKKTEVRNPS